MKTRIMGILNVTPDSFSDGGKYRALPQALTHAERMISEGADIIDVGGESTRPGSEPVTLQEEMDRVLPVVEQLVKMNTRISVDTTKSELAHEALRLGVGMINDVSGLQYDPALADYVAQYNAELVIMHMKGVPKTMQEEPYWQDIVRDIKAFFQDQVSLALNRGVKKEKIILDPGIGFGKRLVDNVDVLKNIGEFKAMGFPVMIGASRKSMIGMISGAEIDDRLAGSLAIACIASLRGADILRVHDVAETVQALKVINEIW
jgi:dihydropteroate synthase